MFDRVESAWKEKVVAKYEALFQRLSGGTEENRVSNNEQSVLVMRQFVSSISQTEHLN
jgi:hypothetical protein